MWTGIVAVVGIVSVTNACGGQVSSNDEGQREVALPAEDAFAWCPTREPRAGTACTDEGNKCVYYTGRACEAAVECDAGKWTSITCNAATR